MTGRKGEKISDPRVWYYDYCHNRVRRILARFWKREMRRKDRRSGKHIEADE